jgi:dTDP-4-dehydrorhamnose 3,5-epimerase-like enzyme
MFADGPNIEGVHVRQARTFINERRVLVITHNGQTPPGELGYTVVVWPGCSVGDHYHHRREERMVLLYGRGHFRLQDKRPGSPTYDHINAFALETPGATVVVPAGVAHAVTAADGLVVLGVLASSDYEPGDDVEVELSTPDLSRRDPPSPSQRQPARPVDHLVE